MIANAFQKSVKELNQNRKQILIMQQIWLKKAAGTDTWSFGESWFNQPKIRCR